MKVFLSLSLSLSPSLYLRNRLIKCIVMEPKSKKDDLLTFQEFKEFGLNIIQSLLKSWIAVLRSRPLNFSSIKLPINLCKLHSWWYLRWFQLILDPRMPRRNGLTKEILKVGCEAEIAWMTSSGANTQQFSRPSIIFYTRQWYATKFLQ